MPIENYGVLVGRPVDRRPAVKSNPHYQIHLVDDTTDHRLAVNVLSQLAPSEVLFLVDEHFNHSITDSLETLSQGFHSLKSSPGGLALDFIRGNLFDHTDMVPLPFNVPGTDNDLNEKLDHIVQRAMAEEDALIYAFGQQWPTENKPDKIFGFRPNTGVHDIHMNQGNVGKFIKDDGVWQDGALMFHFPSNHQWAAVFMAFQSQAWHTDDTTGHRIEVPGGGSPTANDGIIRIVAALVNPVGDDVGRETVTLLNTSPSPIDLSGWNLADRLKNKQALTGSIGAGATRTVTLTNTVQLGNNGGIISLLDANGLKVDGASYTKEQAARQGWTLVF
jgi:uncharacterized protein YukJ